MDAIKKPFMRRLFSITRCNSDCYDTDCVFYRKAACDPQSDYVDNEAFKIKIFRHNFRTEKERDY